MLSLSGVKQIKFAIAQGLYSQKKNRGKKM